jgi:hypothetical protein
MIGWLVAAAWAATPMVLPQSQRAEDWEPALNLVDIVAGQATDGRWVELVPGDAWTIIVHDGGDVIRSTTCPPPIDEESRESLVLLADSLLVDDAVRLPEAEVKSLPAPVQAIAPAPEVEPAPTPSKELVPGLVPAPIPFSPPPTVRALPKPQWRPSRAPKLAPATVPKGAETPTDSDATEVLEATDTTPAPEAPQPPAESLSPTAPQLIGSWSGHVRIPYATTGSRLGLGLTLGRFHTAAYLGFAATISPKGDIDFREEEAFVQLVAGADWPGTRRTGFRTYAGLMVAQRHTAVNNWTNDQVNTMPAITAAFEGTYRLTPALGLVFGAGLHAYTRTFEFAESTGTPTPTASGRIPFRMGLEWFPSRRS